MVLIYSFLGLLGALALSPMGVSAMDCSFGRSENIVDEIINTCPRPLIDRSSEKFCCITSDGHLSCCEFSQFVGSMAFLFLPYIIALLIISCVCCMCCRWCCCSRTTGSVYGGPGYISGMPVATTRVVIQPNVTGQFPSGISNSAYRPL